MVDVSTKLAEGTSQILLDKWNGDMETTPSIAEALRHQWDLKGVRGEADNPSPS